MYPGSGRILVQFANAAGHGRPATFSYVDTSADADTNSDADAYAISNALAYGDAGYRCVHCHDGAGNGYR